jgi:hypothetical protein
LIDFGGCLHQKDQPITFSGHGRLSSPQVLVCRKDRKPIPYTAEDDVFMFGMAMYEVLNGYHHDRVWPGVPNNTVMDKIIQGERPPIPPKKGHPDFVKRIFVSLY